MHGGSIPWVRHFLFCLNVHRTKAGLGIKASFGKYKYSFAGKSWDKKAAEQDEKLEEQERRGEVEMEKLELKLLANFEETSAIQDKKISDLERKIAEQEERITRQEEKIIDQDMKMAETVEDLNQEQERRAELSWRAEAAMEKLESKLLAKFAETSAMRPSKCAMPDNICVLCFICICISNIMT